MAPSSSLGLIVLVGLVGCVGDIGDVGPGPDEPQTIEPPTSPLPEPPATPLRRLTHLEYMAVIDAAFDQDVESPPNPPSHWFALSTQEATDVFTNDASSSIVGVGTFVEFLAKAEKLADTMARYGSYQQRGYVDCEWSDDDAVRDACTELFVREVAPRLYRRPLSEAEHASLMQVYRANTDCLGTDPDCVVLEETDRYRTLLIAMILSPQVLYLLEPEGDGYPAWEESYPWYVASRLSFLLWGTPPDPELYATAEDGSLVQPAVLRAQAERMLDAPAFSQNIGRFVFEMLRLGRWEGFYKNESLSWRCMNTANGCTPDKEIIRANFDENVRRHFLGDGDITDFFTEPNDFGPEMQAYYGDGALYPGILGHPVFSWVHANLNTTSPISRGVAVRERVLLCGHLPAPPMNIPSVPRSEGLSLRERFAQHSDNDGCRACHELIDPLAFVFEAYDWTGRHREEEVAYGGAIVPIDTTSTFGDVDVDGPAELFAEIAASTDARECYVEQLLRFAQLRPVDERDTERRAELSARFEAAEWSLRELLLDIATSDLVLFERESE